MEYLRRDEDEWQRCELVARDSAPPQEVPGPFNLEIAITFDMVVDNRLLVAAGDGQRWAMGG
ncbi:hypothetical protein C7212DRAFT_315520 [Tuber magnatum]|uniref:Uncharacterized protein n=1 Tax=Tuber magnatum TaxID=42249 RepID=A0A317SS81_9PEZI|nr:hypothetical protein C7212DRAFT_315520 [Tuber magnatum]